MESNSSPSEPQATLDNELSIVLPVFNEEAIIERTLLDVNGHLQGLIGNVEIIAVNDGSTDGTAKVLDRLRSSLPVLKVVSHEENRGYGKALHSGIKAAGKKWILLMDADGQFHIDSLGGLWPHRHDVDLLLGYRQQRADAFTRTMPGRLGNMVWRALLGRPIRDFNCAFKIFRRADISPLPLYSKAGTINFEILYRLFKKRPLITWQQYPVEHYPRLTGKAHGGTPRKIFRMLVETISIVIDTHGKQGVHQG